MGAADLEPGTSGLPVRPFRPYGCPVAILQHFFGDDATIAATSVTWPPLGITRSWKTFTEMSKEVIDARVWGGIHTRTADEHADQLGRRVADYAIAKLK